MIYFCSRAEQRKFDCKYRTGAVTIVAGGNRAAVDLNQMPGNGQTQSQAAVLPR